MGKSTIADAESAMLITRRGTETVGSRRWPRKAPLCTRRYPRRWKIHATIQVDIPTGGRDHACIADCFLIAAAYMRACGPAFVLTGGGPNAPARGTVVRPLSLIHISEPTR